MYRIKAGIFIPRGKHLVNMLVKSKACSRIENLNFEHIRGHHTRLLHNL